MKLDSVEIDIKDRRCSFVANGTSYVGSISSWRGLFEDEMLELVERVKVLGYQADNKLFKSIVSVASKKCIILDISDNFLKKDAVAIATILHSSTTLQEVILSNNNLKDSGSEVLRELATITTLSKIDISNNWIKCLDTAIVTELLSHESFSSLDASSNLRELAGFLRILVRR